MTVSLYAFGICIFELIVVPTAPVAEDDPAAKGPGDALSTYTGFVRADMPDEAAIHRPCSPWEDDSEASMR